VNGPVSTDVARRSGRRAQSIIFAAGLAALVVALAACGSSTPSGASVGTLTDPKVILAKSLTALNDAQTFHLTGTLSGTLEADLTNSGTNSAIDLKGTALTADADVPNQRASLSISVPALFALKVDYLQIGPDTYSRNSLSGPDWTHTSQAGGAPSPLPTPRRIGSSSPSPAAGPSGSPEGSLDLVGQITAGLDNLPNPPTLGPAATCGTKSCYTIEISVPLNGSDATGLGLPLPSGAAASVTVTLSVEQDTLLPVHAVAVINAGTNGTFNLALSLSNFNAPVSISAPPPGQVVEESPGP
jgi:hypothetical protein